MTSRVRAGAALALSALLSCAGPVAAPPAPAGRPVQLLLVNDVYVADTTSDGLGGLARIAGLRQQLSTAGPVLVLLAGDVLSPSLLSKYFAGRQMVEAFNAAGLDYATFGNHEFDLPRDSLLARLRESRFHWLSANCSLANGNRFPGVTAWDTVRAGGRLLGLFGLTLAHQYRAWVDCRDPLPAARAVVDTLERLGADWIIGLTHQALADDSALLASDRRIDLILGGHEHEHHELRVGAGLVVKADANARTAQIVTLVGGPGRPAAQAELRTIDGRVPSDPAVAALVRRWSDTLRARLGPEQVIGHAPAPVDGRDSPSRSRETALGDLITDAMRNGTGADVALINAGTLRLDDLILPGPVTNWKLESIFLFPDEARVVRFPLTGERLRVVLEHGLADGSLGAGPFLQVSGVRFSYDPTLPSGSRIVGPLTRPDGAAIATNDTIHVAFDVYPACQAGDGYRLPEARAACETWTRAPRAVDLLMNFIRDSLGGRVAPSTDGRIRRR